MSEVTLKGRICNVRDHGRICFIDLRVEQQVVPAVVSEEYTSNYRVLKSNLYLGAVCRLEGQYFQKEGRTIFKVTNCEVLSRRGLFPKEYPKNEVKDLELRYKNRTWDLIVNKRSFHLLKLRYLLIDRIKSFLRRKGFLEVDVPVLENYYGGALAEPFTTLSNYNSKQYYLRVSLEFPLKKLIISGFKDVFCLGSVFRNQDLDQTHSFQFTTLEFYTTSYSYAQVKALFEEMYSELYYYVYGTHVTPEGVDLRLPWPVYTEQALKELCERENLTVDELLDKNLLGPYCHLENYQKCPLGVSPYRFESYIRGVEIVTAYQEQNDSEALVRDCEAQGYPLTDKSFVHDLSYGMQQTVGLGAGIERIIQSILNEKSIREVQPFPFY